MKIDGKYRLKRVKEILLNFHKMVKDKQVRKIIHFIQHGDHLLSDHDRGD